MKDGAEVCAARSYSLVYIIQADEFTMQVVVAVATTAVAVPIERAVAEALASQVAL